MSENTEETTKVDLNDVEITENNPKQFVDNYKVVEVPTESNSESTIEGKDIPTTEIVEKATGDKKAKANIDTDKFLEANKEEIDKINWDEVKYEDEEKTIPLVTKDDIEVYNAVTSEFVGDMAIEMWVDMAKQEINEYNDLAKRENELQEDEKNYFKSLKNTAKSSKELLALIQTQSIQLRKEFIENKVAETTIKASVLKTLHDFIIKRFPLIPEVRIKKTEEYEDQMNKFMYIIPIFKQSVDRDFDRIKEDVRNNRFNNLDSDAFDYTAAISTYVKNINVKENLDISQIIAKDFEFMNFFVITILYSVYKYGDKDFVTNTIKNIDEKTLKSLDETMIPSIEGIKYENISKIVFEILNIFIETPEIIKTIADTIEISLISDKHIKFYKTENKSYMDVFTEMIKNIPSIEGERLGAWNSYYRSIRKLNLYFTFNELYELGQKNGTTNDEYKAATFNVIIKYIKYVYEHHYTRFISDFVDYLKTAINAKDAREIFFKTSMNYLNAVHSFGFKSSYNKEEGENVAPKIYELAKHRLGKAYDTTIVDETDDILLKDVNLDNVKIEYSKIVLASLEEFKYVIESIPVKAKN